MAERVSVDELYSLGVTFVASVAADAGTDAKKKRRTS